MPMVAAAAASAFAAIGSAIATTATALTFASGITAGLNAWATVASVASLASGMMAKPPKLESQGYDLKTLLAGPSAPIPVVFGRAAVPQQMVFREAGNRNNQDLYVGSVLSAGPISNWLGFYINNRQITWSGNPVKTGNSTGAIPSTGAVGLPSGSKLYRYHLSAAVTLGEWNDSRTLLGLMGQPVPGPHASKPMTGLATIGLKASLRDDAFDGEPDGYSIIDGQLLYDARKDGSVAGGSGPQRINNPATYTYSTNPITAAMNVALGRRLPNGKLFWGVGCEIAELDLPAWLAAANVADLNNWTVGGVTTTGDNAYAVITQLLAAGGARPIARGSQISLVQSAPKVSVLTITADDIIGSVRISTSTGLRDRINRVVPVCRDPNQFYEMVDQAAVQPAAYLAEDGGVSKSEKFELPLSNNRIATTQLAAYFLVDSREFITVDLTGKPRLLNADVGDAVTVDAPDLAINGMKMVVQSRDWKAAEQTVAMSLRVETDAKHEFALGRTAVAPATPALSGFDKTNPDAPGVSAWSITDTAIVAADGSKAPAIVVTGASDNPRTDSIQFHHRVLGATTWTSSGAVEKATTRFEITGLEAGQQYETGVSYTVGAYASAITALPVVTVGTAIASGVRDGGIPWAGSGPGPIADVPPALDVDDDGKLDGGNVTSGVPGKTVKEFNTDQVAFNAQIRADQAAASQSIDDGLAAEAAARASLEATLKAADQTIRDTAATTKTALENADQVIRNSVTAEATARGQLKTSLEAADQAIRDSAATTKAALEAADQTIRNSVTAEATARGQLKTALENADAAIRTSVTAEATARGQLKTALEAADATLTAKTNDLDARLAEAFEALGEGEDGQLGTRITAVEQRATTLETDKASVTDLNAVKTRVTTAEGTLTSQNTRLTTAETNIAGKASNSDFNTLKTEVTTARGSATSLNNRLNTTDTTIAGKASTQSVTDLTTRVSSVEGVNTAQNTRLSTAEVELGKKALATDLTALQGRVTTAETDLTATNTKLNTVETTANNAAKASDLTALTGRVSTAETDLSATKTKLGTVETTANAAAKATDLSALTSTVNTKPQTFAQTTAPSTTGRITGDLWVNTSANNQLNRWSGSAWVAVHDVRGADALAELTAARNGSTSLNAQLQSMRQTSTDLASGKTNVSDFNALTTRVATAEGVNSAQNTRLNTAETDIAGKASAQSVSDLNTSVLGLTTRVGATESATSDLASRKADATRVTSLEAQAKQTPGANLITKGVWTDATVGPWLNVNAVADDGPSGLGRKFVMRTTGTDALHGDLQPGSWQNRKFRATGWVKIPTGTATVGIGVIGQNANGASVNSYAGVSAPSDAWTAFDLVLTAPANMVTGRPFVRSNAPFGVLWTDLRMEDITEARTIDDKLTGVTARVGTVETATANLATNKADATRVSTLEARASDLMSKTLPSTFENGSEFFLGDGSGAWPSSGLILIDTDKGKAWQANTIQYRVITSKSAIPAVVGRTYRATAIVRNTTADANARPWIRFGLYNSSNARLVASANVYASGGTEWETITSTFKVVNAAHVAIKPEVILNYKSGSSANVGGTVALLLIEDITADDLTARVATTETATTNLATNKADASRVTTLENAINTPTTGLTAKVTALQATTTSLASDKANVTDLTALQGRVTTAESDITAAKTKLNTVETTANAAAKASDLSALTTRVTTAEGVNTAQNTRLNTVETDVAGKASAQSVSDLNTSVLGLTTRVGATETATSNLAAQKADASRVTSLEAVANTQSAGLWPSNFRLVDNVFVGWTPQLDSLTPGSTASAGATRGVRSVDQYGEVAWFNGNHNFAPLGYKIQAVAGRIYRLRAAVRTVVDRPDGGESTTYFTLRGNNSAGTYVGSPIGAFNSRGRVSDGWRFVDYYIKITDAIIAAGVTYIKPFMSVNSETLGTGRGESEVAYFETTDATDNWDAKGSNLFTKGVWDNADLGYWTGSSVVADDGPPGLNRKFAIRNSTWDAVNGDLKPGNWQGRKFRATGWVKVPTGTIRPGIGIIGQNTAGAGTNNAVSITGFTNDVWFAFDVIVNATQPFVTARPFIRSDPAHGCLWTDLRMEDITEAQAVDTKLTSVTARVTTTETATTNLQTQKADASRVTTLENAINAPSTGLDAKVSALQATTTQLGADKANASDLTALQGRMTTAENDLTATNTRLNTVETTANSAAKASDLTALTTRVSNAEGVNTAQNTRLTTAESNIAGKASAQSVTDLSSSVAVRNRTFRQNAAPTSPAGGYPLINGDTWINTTSGQNNALSIWTGTAWTTAVDPRIATSAQGVTDINAKIGTVSGTVADALAGKAGASDLTALTGRVSTAETDLSATKTKLSTVETTANNAAKASDVTTLTSTVNTKPQTFAQNSAPSSSGRIVGDIWLNTASNNQLNRWSGTAWVALHDTRGADALAELTAARNGSANLNAQLSTMRQTSTDLGSGKANVSDFNTLRTEVTTARGSASSLNNRLNTAESNINGKASAQSVTDLNSTVGGLTGRMTTVETATANLAANKADASRVTNLEARAGASVNEWANGDLTQGTYGFRHQQGGASGSFTLGQHLDFLYVHKTGGGIQEDGFTTMGSILMGGGPFPGSTNSWGHAGNWRVSAGERIGIAFDAVDESSWQGLPPARWYVAIRLFKLDGSLVGEVAGFNSQWGSGAWHRRGTVFNVTQDGYLTIEAYVQVQGPPTSRISVAGKNFTFSRLAPSATALPIFSAPSDGMLNARVTATETATADLYGKTRARWAIGTSVNGADAFIQAEAEVTPGQPATSSVGIGARAISLYNPAGDDWRLAMRVEGGNAVFTGGLQAGAFIKLGNGQGWPVALRPVDFNASDGEVVNFGTDLGNLPSLAFAMNGLAPLNSGETYDVRAENLTATGFTMRAKINIPATPSAQFIDGPGTSEALGSGNSGRTLNFGGGRPSAPDGVYQLTVNGTQMHRIFSRGGNVPVFDPENNSIETITLAIWAYKGGWQQVTTVYATSFVDSQGYPQGTHNVNASWSFSESIQMPSGVTGINVTRTGSSNGMAGSVNHLGPINWTAQGAGSGVRSATPNGQKTRVTVRPQ